MAGSGNDPVIVSRLPLIRHLAIGAWAGLAMLVAAQAGAIQWETDEGFRRARLRPQGNGPGFARVEARRAGILFSNHVSQTRAILNRNLLNGSGVAAGDFDGDGWCDLYFCGLETDNVLYRNRGGWEFEDVTERAGVACSGLDCTGAVFSDVTGDGRLDLLVTALGHGVRLFRNEGGGRFTEITREAGLESSAGSMSMTLADVEGDGDLDLYVTNYRPDTIADRPAIRFGVQIIDGRPVVIQVDGQPATRPEWTNRFEVSPHGKVLELGEADDFYLNDGSGRFTRVSFTGGTFLDEDGNPLKEPPRDWGLAAQFHDFNGDGAPDLYVCNDFVSPDRIWVNQGKGRFRAVSRTAIRTISTFSMGVDFADLDRDGDTDFFVVDMLSPDPEKRHVQLGERTPVRWPPGLFDQRPQESRNTLQINRGDGTFAELSFYAGVEASDWSWAPIFLDVDLDGFEDILVSNGVLRDFQNVDMARRVEAVRSSRSLSQRDILRLIAEFPALLTPNVAFRNRGDGTFEDVSAHWRFDTRAVSQGMALADLDADGDLDVVINNLGGGPGLYRNESVAPRLAIALRGQKGNPTGVGGRIRVVGGPVIQTQEMICGGRYLSGDQALRVFATGSADRVKVEVTWRNGRQSVFTAEPNFLYELDERTATPASTASEPGPAAWFEEVSLPDLRHVETPFDDFDRQPLLPRSLSQLGPGVCWHDCDGDQREDLVMGSGRGGQLTVLRNLQGGFQSWDSPVLSRKAARDQTTVLGMLNTVVVGSSNYEDGSPKGGLVRIHDFQRDVAGESVLGHSFSCGPLALGDVDGDGDLDLFIGGRVIPGRYPEPADSLLLENADGRLVPAQKFEKLGLISGALFSDLDRDGLPELILAPEWSPIRVFKRVEGQFQERTREWGFDGHSGLWNGVATGDLDGDGQLEVIASNWGLNSALRASRSHPLRLRYGDLNGDGVVDLIESRLDPVLGREVPRRTFDIVSAALPFLVTRVPDFKSYGAMSVQQIYGDSLDALPVLEVTTLESMVFVHRDGRYQGRPLPPEAQWAPAFGIVIGDMDGDGAEDVFLSQNFFAVAPFESRCDAGRGLLLKGDGAGGLQPVPGQESGIGIYGEQRGCALGDYDADGRLDLAVAQNGNAIRLFHNVKAAPGLRVRLRGPPGNPTGVGAQLRWLSSSGSGPAKEVQAGSGYWSQNSPVQVLTWGSAPRPDRLSVRWPGGAVAEVSIPDGASEIELHHDGTVRSL